MANPVIADDGIKGSPVATTTDASPIADDSTKESPATTTTAAAAEGSSTTRQHQQQQQQPSDEAVAAALAALEARARGKWYAYFTTREFWAVLALGQILALCITATNTFTTLLVNKGTSIPAFQTMFNYVFLGIVYGSYTAFQCFFSNSHGADRGKAGKGFGRLPDGRVLFNRAWRYFVLAMFDVQGNYFTVLAYRYTNILSAQLLNFWAIVVVVLISFFVLRVRYRPFQLAGILTCCGGMGLLLASDHLMGVNGGPGVNMVKGDLFGLLGATCYGLSNVFEEYLVSRRPAYEVLAMLGLFGAVINGVQAAIFDRAAFASATWDGQVGGYLTGYTLALALFYSLAPLILRMASAAFFDVSLLTGNFWGVIVGVRVFGYVVHFLYPIAFVLIVCGLVLYFLAGSVLGDARKPWLGATAQQGGVEGLGTARRRAVREARRMGLGGDGDTTAGAGRDGA